MKLTHSLIICTLTGLISTSSTLHAEIVDGKWQVRPGDSVYGIARSLFPDDTKQQTLFRKKLLAANPDIFRGNINLMRAGSQLVIPANTIPDTETVSADENTVKPVARQKPVQPEPGPETVSVPDPEEVIGKVISSAGEMQAENRGDRRNLERNSVILKGDVVTTSQDSHGQIRLKDGALFSLRPGTSMRIEQYQYNGQEDGTERSLIELIIGGFRTITGRIGHTNKNNYRVKTSVATVGIRGTHYGLMLCQAGSCQNNNDPVDDGLYGGVVDGSIVLENKTGLHQFNNDQFFHVTDINLPPVEVLLPPPVLDADTRPVQRKAGKTRVVDAGKTGNGREQDHAGMDQNRKPAMFVPGEKPGMPREPQRFHAGPVIDPLPPLVNTRPEPLPQDFQQLAVVLNNIYDAPPASSMHISFIQTNTDTQHFIGAPIIVGPKGGIKLATLNGIGNIPIAGYEESFDAQFNQLVRHEFAIGNPQTSTFALPSSIGGDPLLGVNWGRWQGNANIVTLVNGQPIPVNHIGDVHFIYSPNITSLTRLAQLSGLGGNVNYANVVGGTPPTDHLGNTGASPPNINISADFSLMAQQISSYTLAVSAGGQSYTNMINDFNGDGVADPIPFSKLNHSFSLGQASAGSCNGGTQCTGEASALFVGPNAEGIITSYSVGEPDGSAGINGTALIRR